MQPLVDEVGDALGLDDVVLVVVRVVVLVVELVDARVVEIDEVLDELELEVLVVVVVAEDVVVVVVVVDVLVIVELEVLPALLPQPTCAPRHKTMLAPVVCNPILLVAKHVPARTCAVESS